MTAKDIICQLLETDGADPSGPDEVAAYVDQFADERNQPVSLEVVNDAGRRFSVQIAWDGREPTVSFYDASRADKQFISRYFAASIVTHPTHGLDLAGGVPEWKIDAETMAKVVSWTRQEVQKRGYRLVPHEEFGIDLGMRYESLDADDSASFLATYKTYDEIMRELASALMSRFPNESFNVTAMPNSFVVFATTFSPPEKDRFAASFRDYVLKWVRTNTTTVVSSSKLSVSPNFRAHKGYPEWHAVMAVNVDWPPDAPEYVEQPQA